MVRDVDDVFILFSATQRLFLPFQAFLYPSRISSSVKSSHEGLQTYLSGINEQAQERFERLIDGMKQAQGITEQLKAENALEWVRRMNNIRACAMEIVNKEIIFA